MATISIASAATSGRKVAAEDVKGYEAEIEKHPDDAGLHDDVALLYMELGKNGKASSTSKRRSR
jgi:hypothetical protein